MYPLPFSQMISGETKWHSCGLLPLYIAICVFICCTILEGMCVAKYLLYEAEKPYVCLSVHLTITPISQPCQHGLKRDLLEMKAESSGTTKYVFKSLYVRLLIHTSV